MPRHVLSCSKDGGFAQVQLLILSVFAAMLRPCNYRGMRKACRLVGLFFPRTNDVVISDGKRKFKIYLNDPYWIKHVFAGFSYENEVANVLDKVLDSDSVFIDCGANTGYWSVYAARKIGPRDHVLAVEPAETTFARLCENMELNDRSFAVLRRAIFSHPDIDLKLRTHPERHGSNTCIFDPGDREQSDYRIECVKSVTIDDLFRKVCSPDEEISNVVVKIDVEGAEIEALQGAQTLIARGALFVYEDHGRDLSCHVTDYVLNTCGLDVYFLHAYPTPLRVENVTQLIKLKKTAASGYNLMAAHPDSPALSRVLGRVSSNPAQENSLDLLTCGQIHRTQAEQYKPTNKLEIRR